MKNMFLAAFFLLISQSNFAQIRTKSVIKPVVKPEKIIQHAGEIDVYIAIQDGIYTTDEIYALFRGENPKIKLMAYSYGAPSINPQVTAINGVFPSLVTNYQTIKYKLQIANTDKLTVIVACIDEQELANKDAQIEIDFKNESCSGMLSKNKTRFLGKARGPSPKALALPAKNSNNAPRASIRQRCPVLYTLH